jgi:N-dimethylarginine dimethylaminohydrolase
VPELGGDPTAGRTARQVQHLEAVDWARLRREMLNLKRVFLRLGVEVWTVSSAHLPDGLNRATPNLIFARDLFFNTPEGAVISRMASHVRAGEEKFAAAALARQGVPLRGLIGGRGLFEGADALWLDARTVAVGVGARTNRSGFLQLRDILHTQGVRAVAVPMPRGVQHLLGLLQIVARDLAVIRIDKAPPTLIRLLKRRGFELIPVRESAEVQPGQGMNFVTLGPRRVLMADGCPRLREQLENAGLRIAATASIPQLRRAAGGLACATGIVGRKTTT